MRGIVRAATLLLALLPTVAACTGTGNPSDGHVKRTALPAAAASASRASAQPLPNLQARLDDARQSYGAPGALAVLRLGGTELSARSGAADTAGTAITATTRFRIASITKPIVASLVLDAVARGQLALDDVVGDILPGVLRPDPPVTVRQLLDHTAGIFDEGNDGDPVADFEKLADPALRDEARSLLARYQVGERVIVPDRLLVALAETHDRYNAPGEAYHYSNIGYQLAAMVVEKASGQHLADLLRGRIVEPLGLRHTTIAPPDTASPEFRGYGTDADDGSLVDLTDDLLAFGNGGNGGVISTADELLTVTQAIVSGRLLPTQFVEQMKRPTIGTYGLGLATYALPCGTFYGHGGSVNGTQSIAMVSAEGADGVVIALNLRSGSDPDLPGLASQLLCPSQS